MKLTEISLKRPVTVAMFFVCVAVIGLIGGERLPLELLPDIQFPGLVVNVPYRNSTPEEVERRITRPVEEVLATIPGIQRINSESRDDGTQIELRFGFDSDMAVRGVEVRDKIDSIRANLPLDIERIQIQRFSANDQPVLVLRISADRDLSNAYDLLNRNVKRRLERLNGVSKVELYGVEPKEVRVELAADRVAAHGVDLAKLAQTMAKANFSVTGGDLVEAGKRYYVKPEGRFARVEDVGDMVIDQGGLRLRDIAEIRYAQPELNYGRHLNRRYAIGVNVFKETGANLVEVCKQAMAEIEQIKQLPEMHGINLILFQNSGADVKHSLNNLLEAGLIGALLSVIVLFTFLRDWRMTLIVTLAVPLSLLMTLAAMYFLGYSINILTLMGLMLSIGMLVDNSVVVTESIFKHNAELRDPRAATLAGVGSVGLAVVLGTLATAIVFLPNIFGAQSEITIYLSHVAITICLSLAASLLVAITLIPQLTSRVLTQVDTRGAAWVQRLSARYLRLLEWTLAHRGRTALFIVLLIASVVIPASQVKTEMFSDSSEKRLFMDYHLNGVYSLDKVESAVNTVEDYLDRNRARFEIQDIYSYFDLGRAITMVYLKDPEHRLKSGEQLKDEIRKELPHIAIGEPSFEENRGANNDKLAVQIYGQSRDGLREVASRVAATMRGIPGLADVHVDVGASSWEVRVRVDRDRARMHGLSSQQVAEVVAGAMRGSELKPFRTSTGEIEMRLQFREEDRTNLDALLSLPLITPTGERIALSTVADLSIGDVPGTIKREDRRTSLAINFSTKPGVTADEAKKRVNALLDSLQFPSGYGWGLGHAFDDDQEQMQTMLVNMALALACIYIVMAALFESTLAPTAIISGILFSFIGVYWFFFATHTTFSFMAMIGMLVLMGVVVNNGIVLIDHVHQLREAGLTRERALVQGSRDRLRPILMTAASTILGMVPLALGDTTIGGDGPPYYPMARAVIGGLLFATVVSLIVLPTIYLMIDDLILWGRRVMARARGQQARIEKPSSTAAEGGPAIES
ncbi:MAG: efflux RND transporter permease subunit [Nevskiaceae bacterium]|nr:MAG: efflux RND transporter permease subunit [Nevskiaceae bacterium]